MLWRQAASSRLQQQVDVAPAATAGVRCPGGVGRPSSWLQQRVAIVLDPVRQSVFPAVTAVGLSWPHRWLATVLAVEGGPCTDGGRCSGRGVRRQCRSAKLPNHFGHGFEPLNRFTVCPLEYFVHGTPCVLDSQGSEWPLSRLQWSVNGTSGGDVVIIVLARNCRDGKGCLLFLPQRLLA